MTIHPDLYPHAKRISDEMHLSRCIATSTRPIRAHRIVARVNDDPLNLRGWALVCLAVALVAAAMWGLGL